MEINYNHQGKWSVEAARLRYTELRTRLGGAEGFELTPRTHTNKHGITWTYSIMDAVADGVQLGDRACIQLATDSIER